MFTKFLNSYRKKTKKKRMEARFYFGILKISIKLTWFNKKRGLVNLERKENRQKKGNVKTAHFSLNCTKSR